MAMADYGAILKINGKIVNKNEDFMDMQKAVGWVDYPRIRYEDCDYFDEDGCSCCGDCPRAQRKHMSHPELGEWDHVTGDCRGNPIRIDGKIDHNCFAYAGDEDFTVATYKTGFVMTNKKASFKLYCYDLILGDDEKWEPHVSKMARNITVQIGGTPVSIKVKRIGESHVFYMRFWYKNNLYQMIYGYGIDSEKEVWDEVKTRYANKKVIRFVDNFWKEN